MDINTDNKLSDYKDNLLEYLLNKDEDLKTKWNNNEEILFNYEIYNKFEPLMYGDWNRNPLEYKLNLSKIKNKSFKPNQIFDMIIKEITTKSKPYAYNINPNWFFLFYDKFYNYPLKKKLYLTFNYSEETKCLNFDNYHKISKIIREEVLNIIVFHSRFVLSGNIKDYLNIKYFKKNSENNLFEEIFIKNCIIQKPINIGDNTKRYVDLCYNFNNNNLILEINEYHHEPLLDIMRQKSIIIKSKDTKNTIVHFDTTKYSSEYILEIANLLVKKLCKILYQKEIVLETALQIYLTDVENLDQQFVDLYLDFKNKKSYNINELFTTFISNQNDDFNNKVIKQHVKYGNINYEKDFETHNEYYKELIKIKDNSKKEICEFIINNKDKLYITYFGFKNFIMTMKNKDCPNRNDLLIHLDNVENNYYKCIIDFMENNDLEHFYEELDHLQKLNAILNATILKTIDTEKYMDKVIKLRKDKDYDTYKFHLFVPFLVKDESKIFKYNDILPLILERDKHKVSYDRRDDYLRGYRLLTVNEMKNIIK